MTTYGKVEGLFKTLVVDSQDPDTIPDQVPLQGFIDFVLNVTRVVDSTDNLEPIIFGTSTITAIIDPQGYLCTPDDTGTAPQYRGLYLPATDDLDWNPHQNVAYNVTYRLKDKLGKPIPLPSHLVSILGGTTLNLANVIPPDGAPAISLAAAEAAAASAAESAALAVSKSLSFVVLEAGESVPPGTPSNTVIIRKAP